MECPLYLRKAIIRFKMEGKGACPVGEKTLASMYEL